VAYREKIENRKIKNCFNLFDEAQKHLDQDIFSFFDIQRYKSFEHRIEFADYSILACQNKMVMSLYLLGKAENTSARVSRNMLFHFQHCRSFRKVKQKNTQHRKKK